MARSSTGKSTTTGFLDNPVEAHWSSHNQQLRILVSDMNIVRDIFYDYCCEQLCKLLLSEGSWDLSEIEGKAGGLV